AALVPRGEPHPKPRPQSAAPPPERGAPDVYVNCQRTTWSLSRESLRPGILPHPEPVCPILVACPDSALSAMLGSLGAVKGRAAGRCRSPLAPRSEPSPPRSESSPPRSESSP